MKVAVSAAGPDLSNAVDPRFGRASWFVIVDTDTGVHEAVENTQNLEAIQGAGIQSAECVARKDAKAVLTGHCGPKAFRALSAAAINVYVGVDGTVGDAVERFKAGAFASTEGADVAAHWA